MSNVDFRHKDNQIALTQYIILKKIALIESKPTNNLPSSCENND